MVDTDLPGVRMFLGIDTAVEKEPYPWIAMPTFKSAGYLMADPTRKIIDADFKRSVLEIKEYYIAGEELTDDFT